MKVMLKRSQFRNLSKILDNLLNIYKYSSKIIITINVMNNDFNYVDEYISTYKSNYMRRNILLYNENPKRIKICIV